MKILPIINRIFKSGKSVINRAAGKIPPAASVQITEPVFVKSSVPVVSKTAGTAEVDPFLESIYKLYEMDGVSRDIVDEIVLSGKRLRYYRYVGEEELRKLLSGQRVTSSRPCYDSYLTDVTSDPNYDKIPTLGKYRLTFKDKKEFSPYPLHNDKNSRITEHNLKNLEFYLRGGYDLSDIEKIEQKQARIVLGCWICWDNLVL